MSTEENNMGGRGYSALSRRYVDRRIVLKAAAGLSAIAAAGGFTAALSGSAVAQEAATTRATRFIPAEAGGDFAAAATTDWLTFTADYTFTALGASWSSVNGESPEIDLQLSTGDGVWSDSYRLTAQVEDGGRENRDDRIFTWLLFTTGAIDVRYRTQNSSGTAMTIEDLSIVYLDSDGGAAEEELDGFTTAAEGTTVSPRIVNRTQWGANESYLNWDPEYETVSHIIIHHTATSNNVSDWAQAVRNIYYYHAVEQGWGDIGYNYLVSPTGTIYEGRFGGQNVIGGHAYQYAVGSSGISLLGDYTSRTVPQAGLSALATITAFVARDLDPLGTADFLEAPDLPIISSHRDVSSTSCPGDRLWTSLPNLRTLVAETLADGDLETDNPGGVVIGDRVTVTTDDDGPLNVRSTANGTVSGNVVNATMGWVIEGPTVLPDANWYRVEFPTITGWVSATFLTVTPPPPPASDETFFFGVNITINAQTNVRSAASTSSGNVGSAPAGTSGFVLAGPTTANGFEWYQIAFPNNVVDDGWVTKQVLTVSAVDEDPDAKFTVPSNAVVTERVNVRVRPGIAQTIQGTAAAGTKIKLTVGPLGIDGFIFYGAYGPFGGGWVVEDFIRADTTTPVTGKFVLGDTILSNSSVNLRSSASTSGSIIRTLTAGVNATVTGGPSNANGYNWYLIRLSTGETGWAAQDFWDKTTAPTDPPPTTGKFAIGDTVRVTESLRLRSSAGTSGGIITSLSPGTTGTVLAGPTSANGYTWWRLQTSAGAGWAADEWLVKTTAPTDPPPPTTGKFEIGDTVQVTESLRLRTSASTSGGIITSLSPGTTGTVLAGPTTANGYTWWRLQTSAGAGWAAD
ncbi:MAG: SH3 domain-containing protein, partial [Thermomicrobiales bacterium]